MTTSSPRRRAARASVRASLDADPSLRLRAAVLDHANDIPVIKSTAHVGDMFRAQVDAVPHTPLQGVAIAVRMSIVTFRVAYEYLCRHAATDPELAGLTDLEAYRSAIATMVHYGVGALPPQETDQ